MANQTDISIIIPVYNVEPYIRRCIESIFQQESPQVALECIVINDCTKDASMDIVREMLADYTGNIDFRLIENPKNMGISATRNRGVELATGEFVIFVDSDDHVPSHSFEKLLAAYRQYPHAGLVVGNTLQCKDGQKQNGDITEPLLICDTLESCRMMLHMQLSSYPWNKLVRKQVLIDLGLQFPEGYIYEDICWTYTLYSYQKPVVLLPDVTYIYENNVTSYVNTVAQKADLNLRSYLLVCNELMDKCQKQLFVDLHIYVFLFLIRSVDIKSKYFVSAEAVATLHATRSRLLGRALRHWRLLLAVLFLLLYSPFTWLQRVRYFRTHVDRLAVMVRRLAEKFNWLHP